MKSFFKGAFLSVLFLIPAFAVIAYGFMGSFGCGLGMGHGFDCRFIVPLFWLSGIVSLGLALALGPSIAMGKRVRTVLIVYVITVAFAPASAFVYFQVLPESFKQEALEGKTEDRCVALSGTERESCLLKVFRTRLFSGPGDISWCEQIKDSVAKTRCQSDVKASQGDGSLCTRLTDAYPSGYHGYPGGASAEEIALSERESCYNTAVFALGNSYVNANYGDYRYSYDEAECAAEPREITKNYCYFRLGRCDLIDNPVISRDCVAYKGAYSIEGADSSQPQSLPPIPNR